MCRFSGIKVHNSSLYFFRDNALSMEELSDLLEDLFCTNSHSLSEDMAQKIFSLLDEDKVRHFTLVRN